MKEEKSFYEQEKDLEQQKVIEQKPALLSNNKLKKIAIIGLATVIGLTLVHNTKKNIEASEIEPEYKMVPGIEYTYDENDYVAPIEKIVYTAPSGYTLVGDKAVKRVTSFIQATKKVDKDGKTYYSVPEGYTLVYIDDMACGEKTTEEIIDAARTVIYEAPAGYILIDNKCYKIVREEKEIPVRTR